MSRISRDLMLLLSIFLLATGPSPAEERGIDVKFISIDLSNPANLSPLWTFSDGSRSDMVYFIGDGTIYQIRRHLENLTYNFTSNLTPSSKPAPMELAGNREKKTEQNPPALESEKDEIFDPTSSMQAGPHIPIGEEIWDGSRQSSGGVTVIWQP